MINSETRLKQFFWKDKTGRGFSNTLTLEDVLNLEDEQDYSDNFLHEWAENAEEGDEWEDRTMKFTCIESKK
jgi:hypothetical protein